MMFTGFCNQCTPKTHLQILSHPSSAPLSTTWFPLSVLVWFAGLRHLVRWRRPSLHSLGDGVAPTATSSLSIRPLVWIALPQPAPLEHPMSQADPWGRLDTFLRLLGGLQQLDQLAQTTMLAHRGP